MSNVFQSRPLPGRSQFKEAEDMALGLLTSVELRAREALSRSAIYVLREIEVELDGGAIRLTGSVDSFYHKQLAQELVKNVLEGVEVVNALRVDYNRALKRAATT